MKHGHTLCSLFTWLFLVGYLYAQNHPHAHGTVSHYTKRNLDCGHILDGPMYGFKQMENASLDRLFTLTKAQKKEIGELSHKKRKKEHRILSHFKDKAVVLDLFDRLKQKANSTTDFALYVISSPTINAFTTIGGHIYITTGLLDYVTSADELAFIIGHEMGHHEKLHLERKIKKTMTTTRLFGKVGIAEFTKIAIALNHKVSAPFDQIDEYEADTYGFDLAKKAGYDTSRFTDFFKRMEKNEKRSLLAKLNSTHPFSKDRKKCLENLGTH